MLDALIGLLEFSEHRPMLEMNDLIDRHILPVVQAVGIRWPGRMRYRDWFLIRGSRIARSPFSTSIALIAAALFSDDRQIRDLFHTQALLDHNAQIRWVAVQAVAVGWRDGPGTLPLLREWATDGHGDVRRVVVVEAVAVGWRDDPGTLPWLRERATDDTDGAVRWVAVQAVRQIERR
ncbi:HEAT repeat domain-containing protein [Frankia sp. CiP3]|uniref:HEAT repeat domain-containing protein n=1 Tax=Frankia sp. CiP3 TaxID=2880971 RepID=UPI001EF421B2|nr:HEAT repeat domain-containing protein [Frankia sp. CiP3]